MSEQTNQMALQQKVYELTERFESLEQSTQFLQLEKEEYEREVEKLKYNNADLLEKLNFLETITKESKQRAVLLSRQLSTNASEFDAESVENRELKNRLRQNIKVINSISKANELFKETNKRLQFELENVNMKYEKYTTDSKHEIEEYKTKIMELQTENNILQQQRIVSTLPNTAIEYSAPSNSYSDINDDISEEKLSEHPHGQLKRQTTQDLKLTSLISASYRQQRSGSMSMSKGSVIMTPRSQRISDGLYLHAMKPMMSIKQSQEFSQEFADNVKHNIVLPDDYYDDNDEFDDNTTEDMQTKFVNNNSLNFGRGSVASFMSYASYNHHNNKFVFENNDNDARSPVSNDSSELYDEKLKEIIDAQQLKMDELNEMLHREEIGFEIKQKVFNKKIETLTQQLYEKDKMIQKYTRQNTELREEYKKKELKLVNDWKSEKQKLVEKMYKQQKMSGEEMEAIIEENEQTIMRLKHEMIELSNKYKGIETKLNKKRKEIKKLDAKNKQLQIIVTETETDAPTSSSCYVSVAQWFKFS